MTATDARIAITSSEPKILRHGLAERLFHWILAASFLTLLVSAFGPILGWKFDWVPIHWVAGIVMTLAILFHLWRALLSLDFWLMMIDRTDLRDVRRGVNALEGRGPLPGRPGKYELGQKLFHWGIAGVAAGLIATGLLMLAKLDTPFWQRCRHGAGEFHERTNLADIEEADLDLALGDLLLAGIEADDSDLRFDRIHQAGIHEDAVGENAAAVGHRGIGHGNRRCLHQRLLERIRRGNVGRRRFLAYRYADAAARDLDPRIRLHASELGVIVHGGDRLHDDIKSFAVGQFL